MKERLIEEIAAKVSAKISPTPDEARAEKRFAEGIIKKISAKLGKTADMVFIGSAARDTGIRGDKDIDLFARFPAKHDKEFIVKKTIEATKKAIPTKWEMHYAEHPYLQTTLQGYKVEVIPCFKIDAHSKIKSAVDRSPLHMDYLQENLSEKQKRDVRVLKQFLKNAGLYGAEAAVEGFSGIMCEYLVLNYRSFAGTVNAVKDWKPPVRIDFVESKKRFDAPLTLIDAIDENRNVAAVISATNVNRFVSLCRAFAEKPEYEKFFSLKTKPPAKTGAVQAARKRGTHFLLISFIAPDEVEDTVVPQLRKTQRTVARHLELLGFRVFGSHSFLEKRNASILLELEHASIPKVRRTAGPPVSNAKACAEFVKGKKKVLRGPFVEGERLCVEEERSETSAKNALKKMFSSPVEYGVAPALVKGFRKAGIIEDLSKTPSAAAGVLSEYLFRKEFWL